MQTNTNIERVLFTINDVSDALGIGRTLAWRLVRGGALPSVRIGKRRLVPAAAVKDYVARLAREAAQ